MDQSLFLILLFSGLSVLPSSLPHQFHFVNMTETWTEAQSFCRQNYTDLATIDDDMADMKKLNNTVSASWSGSAWIGLYLSRFIQPAVGIINTSLGVWSDQSGSSYRNWDSNEPNWGDDVDFCAEVTFSGKWNDAGCNFSKNFICYDDELVLVSENKTWSEALWHCRDLDMELVSAHNQSIQHWVQQRAKMASSLFVWLGLRYTCTLDFWFWVNGEESCYHNWANGEGYNTSKEQCGNTGAIQRDGGQWVGKAENERFNFICSKSDDY
ncbi:macrophage mannose receptor 1-like isoform X2 [Salmo trutta]|uniref:Macrophage mannose receptor 1-like n=1 Tax=Salmo trutta TaxID=8032 RepID=A0A674CNZ8_SALTR|nr:macrophage mannose receptor 1-like isoform X2 [Salmo trutta]XP_029626204.1 macrophage mannose receptor 1-like isoform X2 [Salmo trutta]